jgi:hypothetical protein
MTIMRLLLRLESPVTDSLSRPYPIGTHPPIPNSTCSSELINSLGGIQKQAANEEMVL